MKRSVALFLTIALILLVPSCAPNREQNGKLVIVTTIFPQYDFARAVSSEVQDKVELTMLLPPGSESHDYEPSLADLALIEGCDLFICVGGETDAWVDSAIEAVGGNVNVLRLVDCVPLLSEPADGIIEDSHEHHEHGEDEECREHHGHEDEAFDEHVWTSIDNALLLTDAICEAMCKAEPSLADSFRKGAESYCEKLSSLSDKFSALAENAVGDTLYFADRFPFRYLLASMGLGFRASFSGCSSDSEPALSTIYELTCEIKKSNASVIFVTEFSSKSTADVIAKECGLEVLTLHSCHNVSKEDLDGGVTYLALMEENLAVLTRALT